jgi:hypothetical protein
MGRPDLRLTLKEAVRLPASLGISHVALGEIQGKGGRCALTYQLVDLSTRKGVGASLVARGSEAELVAGLPGLLRQLCARLGVKPPQAPATVSESAADLQALGRMPWRPDETIPQKWLDLLDGLSRRSALGALLFLINRGDVQDARVAREAADLLRKQAPGHPLALAEIGRQFQTASAGPPGLETAPGLARFPNSYLLATAAMWQHREAGDFAAARKAGEQAVRCSLQNPQAWLDLGGVFRGQADFLRRGRVVGELSPGERDYCRKLYVLWLKMAAQAARIDPGNSAAWGQVSNAAAFAGQGKVADSAFWKAVALEQENPLPDDPGLYNWGLELYHPLWYEDRAKAARVAKLAAAEAASAGDKWPPSARVDLALALHLDGFPVLAAGMVRTAWERAALKKAIAENQDQDGAPEAGETGSEEEQ